MFCPRCGQQQASEEMRFCSRCGLPLAGVQQLIEAGSKLVPGEEGKGAPLTKKQKGVRQGRRIMFVGLLMLVVAIMLGFIDDDLFALVLPAFIVLFVGLVRWLYAKLFQKDTPSRVESSPSLYAPPRATELPPARGFPAPDFARASGKTAEMAQPPSVTENTTRLLEDEERG